MRRMSTIVAGILLLTLIGMSVSAQHGSANNPPAGAGPQMGMMGGMPMDQMMRMGMMHPSIAVDDTAIYIVRGNEVLKLDKSTLQVISRSMLPTAPMGGTGGTTGAGTGGGPGTVGTPSAQFDRSFLQNMIRHHAGAIAMSRIAMEKATHPELRLFARRVIQTQSAQDRQMAAWLRGWYGTRASTEMMPEDAQAVQQLRNLSGRNLEIMYIRTMIAHHNESIEMSRNAEQRATRASAKALATNIVRDQSREVQQLRSWLSKWYGASE